MWKQMLQQSLKQIMWMLLVSDYFLNIFLVAAPEDKYEVNKYKYV